MSAFDSNPTLVPPRKPASFARTFSVPWAWLSVMFLVLAVALGSRPVQAAETDQYYSWRYPVADASTVFHQKINEEIGAALEDVNSTWWMQPFTCQDVAQEIESRFSFVGLHKIELWAQLANGLPRQPTDHAYYRRHNIYRYNHPLYWDLTFVWLGKTVQIGGVSFGTDKLGHFFKQGWRYYQTFREVLSKNDDTGAALQAAIDVGVTQELTWLGLGASGVFSYADLEANYQGFRFFYDLCDGPEQLLRINDQGWYLREPVDLRAYVNPWWDESLNNCAYTEERWLGVKQALKDYCPLLEEPHVQARRRTLRRNPRPSVSTLYLAALAEIGRIPDNHSFSIEQACGPVQPPDRGVSGR